MEKQRSFLKWAGGKYNCLSQILPKLPQGNRFIEPFTGSATLFLNTHYSEYLLAEKNKDLIELYRLVQQDGLPFIELCKALFSPANNCIEQYQKLRAEFNQSIDTRRKSALFLYLNRHGYNGLCRYNQTGGYNVPFGRHKKPYFPLQELINFHSKSQSATFLHADFRTTFSQAKTNDVIYCDPPYAPLDDQHSNFSAYTQVKFGEEEQIALVKEINLANERGISVIISNHDTPFTRQLYRHAKITSFPVRRYISRNTQNRLQVKELVAVFSV